MDNRPLLTVVIIFLFIAANMRGIISTESNAIRVLENAGYSDIVITDKDVFVVGFRGCSEKDAAKFEVTAVNPAGKKVHTNVCTGILKGGTIRS